MGAPYAPLGQVSPASAVGPSSFSKLFAWVALGVMVGLWLGSHPTVQIAADSARRGRRVLVGAGVALSVLLVVATIVNAACCLFAVADGMGSWGVVAEGHPISHAIKPAVTFVLHNGAILALASGLLCGVGGQLVLRGNPRPMGGARRSGAAVVVCFLAGLLQPLAWTLLLPHSPFPQPMPLVTPAGASAVWDAGTLGPLVLAIPIPGLLMFVLALALTGTLPTRVRDVRPGGANDEARDVEEARRSAGGCGSTAGIGGVRDDWPDGTGRTAEESLMPLAALCLGVLGFRAVTRVVPTVCATPLLLALGALVAYLGLFAAMLVLARRAGLVRADVRERRCGGGLAVGGHPVTSGAVGRVAAGTAADGALVGCAVDGEEEADGFGGRAVTGVSFGPETPHTLDELRAVLTPHIRDSLAREGLTEQEVLIVCAHACALTSSQAGSLMGIAEPTVREYRRRARRKLGVETLNDALARLVGTPEMMGGGGDAHLMPAVGGRGGCLANGYDSRASVPAAPDIAPDETHGVRLAVTVAATLALCCLLAVAVLALIPAWGTVRMWSDVWTASFGMGAGLVAAWAVRAYAIGTGDSRSLVAFAAFGAVLSAGALAAVRMGALPALADAGTARAGASLLAMALCTACLDVLARHAMALLRASDMDVLTATALVALAGGGALACGQLGALPWGLALVAMAAIGAMGSLLAFFLARALPRETRAGVLAGASAVPEGCAHPADGEGVRASGAVPDLCWLAAAVLFGWTWTEAWHAQAYDSLLGVLQWGLLALLVIATYRELAADVVRPLAVAVASGMALLAGALCGLGIALLAYGLVLAVACTLGSPERAAGRCAGAALSWHASALATAFGLVAGVLASFALGDVAGGRVQLPNAGGDVSPAALASGAIVLVFILTSLACLVSATRGEALSLALSQKQRVRVRLAGRGLSERQIDVALRLAAGCSVMQVAAELAYSRSTIVLARRDIYRMLGIQARDQLTAYLRALAAEA